MYHALYRAGIGHEDITLVTELPISDYFIGNAKNRDLIDRKMNNLEKYPPRNMNENVNLPVIRKHHVLSAGIAAFFDLLLDFDGRENDDIQELIEDQPIAIVDIGGRTTDIAVVAEGARVCNPVFGYGSDWCLVIA